MKTAPEIQSALQEELRSVAARCGCELLHCEFKGGTLRLVLDREEGVTLEDCEAVSRQASALLDVEDFGAGRYLLEVSSPGLDRPLYRPADYQRFHGRRVRVTWQEPGMERKRTLVARLEEFQEEDGGRAALVDDTTGERYTISLKYIHLARLEPEW